MCLLEEKEKNHSSERRPICTVSSIPQCVSRRLLNPCQQHPAGWVNQTQRDTPLLERVLDIVTITDPTHPLYGQTLPRLPVRTHRSTPHVMVLLPTGRRHTIPRAVTNLECPVEVVSHSSPLPAISVRTILPLARLVQQLKQAKEESHAKQAASTIHSTEQCAPSFHDALASAPPEQPAATRSPGRRPHSAQAKSRTRQGAQP